MTQLPNSNWLQGRKAVIVGQGVSIEAVEIALQHAGVRVYRAEYVDDLETAVGMLKALTIQAQGAPDILIHAGSLEELPATEDMDLAAWRDAMKKNLDSKFFFSSAFARTIIGTERKGCILYLDRPERGSDAAMVAAGGAMSSLTKTLSVEWARDAIRVNAIVSDAVYAGDEAQLEALGNMATYLCSDFAGYVTGATVGIDDEI